MPLDEGTIAKTVLDGIKGWFFPASPEGGLSGTTLEVTKQADGRLRVLMRVSNNFKDRHGEIITEAAHREYEKYVAKEGSQAYPEFWLWHQQASKWGQADLVSYDDGILTVSGLADPNKEYIAEGLSRLSDRVGVSHGFKGWGTGDGLIHWYRMKECSPLPRTEAANVWTGLEVLGLSNSNGGGMALLEKHKKFFTELGVPVPVIEDWDKTNKDIAGAARGAGFEFKDIGEPEAKPATEGPAATDDGKAKVTLEDGTVVTVTKNVVDLLKQGPPSAPAKPGTPPVVGTPVAQAPSDSEGVPSWAKELIESNKALAKELEDVKSKQTVESWEAAIRQGTGFVASKEGESPSKVEQDAEGLWLAELIAGSPVGGSH